MTKEQLRRILEAKTILKNYYGDGTRHFSTQFSYFEKTYVHGREVRVREEDWFPKVDDLKDEFEILKKEIKDVVKNKNDAENFFKNYKCNHPVRISNFDYGYRNKYVDKCMLCGEKLSNSVINRASDIKTIAEKNNEFVTFIGKEDVTPDGFLVDYEYVINYTEEDIIEILQKLLENIDSEEFDLVYEIEKLNLEKCVINKPQNKSLILVIAGSNKEYIDNYSYITSKNNINDKKILDHFLNLYNAATLIVGDDNTLKKYELKDDLLVYMEYDTIEKLNTVLNYYTNVPFDLIIDISSLYTYKLGNTQEERYKLPLKDMFPNTRIVTIKDFSNNTMENMENYLKDASYNTYACQHDRYNTCYTYYDKDDMEKKKSIDDACNEVIRLIKHDRVKK